MFAIVCDTLPRECNASPGLSCVLSSASPSAGKPLLYVTICSAMMVQALLTATGVKLLLSVGVKTNGYEQKSGRSVLSDNLFTAD
jgi:hypothetical protein